jgi:hypothetical protein
MATTKNTCLLVINPSIRFTWIAKNWDDKYIKRATIEIKALVSVMHPSILIKFT